MITNCVTQITRIDSIKDLAVFIDAKLHFHDSVNFIFSQRIKLLCIVRSIIYNNFLLFIFRIFAQIVHRIG
jgi:hypothetical protein